MTLHRSLLSALGCAALGVSLFTTPARGAEPDNKAQARALFESAMSQIAQGRFSDAVCAQLGESQRLDPALGTHYQWARCLENTGRLASAWAMYLDVAEVAGSQKLPEQQRFAKERADALKPKLTKLIITVPVELQQQAKGLEVRRDGVLVTQTQYGLALPVDGGRHEISVVAAGRRKWTTTVEAPAGTEGATITVSVPTLTEDPVLGIRGSTHDQKEQGRWTAQHSVGVVAAGLGVVGLGLMAGFGVDTFQKHAAAKPYCSADFKFCHAPGLVFEEQAHASAIAANASLAAGLTLIAAGATLFLAAPSPSDVKAAPKPRPPTAAVSIRFVAGPVAAGAALQGAF